MCLPGSEAVVSPEMKQSTFSQELEHFYPNEMEALRQEGGRALTTQYPRAPRRLHCPATTAFAWNYLLSRFQLLLSLVFQYKCPCLDPLLFFISFV